MNSTSRFQTGQTVLYREIWQDQLWEARPEIIVRDSDDMIASYLPGSGTVYKKSYAHDGSPAGIRQMQDMNWKLEDTMWFGLNRIRLTIPGEPYSVLLFREADTDVFSAWYINFEDPLVRTPQGFDYTDLILDIVAFPDLSHWRWKDEHELRTALEYNMISQDKAESLYQKGEEVISWLQSGTSPFSEWIKWTPDPAWTTPVLPETWDTL